MSTIQTPPRASESTWPLVLGIIGLVFGIGGILSYGCLANVSMAMFLFMGDFFKQMGQQAPGMQMNAAQAEVMREWAPYAMGTNSLMALVAIVLIVASVGLLRRRPGARRWWLAWAGLRILVSIPATIVSLLMNRQMFEAMGEAAQSGGPPALSTWFELAESFGWVGMAFGLLWAWTLPVFSLVWFNRRAIRDEVAGWSTAAPRP